MQAKPATLLLALLLALAAAAWGRSYLRTDLLRLASLPLADQWSIQAWSAGGRIAIVLYHHAWSRQREGPYWGAWPPHQGDPGPLDPATYARDMRGGSLGAAGFFWEARPNPMLDERRFAVTIGYWHLVAASCLGAAAAIVAKHRLRRRFCARDGLCPHCRYPLGRSANCPECGTPARSRQVSPPLGIPPGPRSG